MVTETIAKASASTKCPAQNFIISATHTHSGSPSGPDAAGPVGDAIVSAVEKAKANLAPARIGYGTGKVDLNVNRDLFNSKQEWRQQPNPEGPSDKTLAVVEFVGADDIPIAVYMNYAMHPVNFYMTGVVSADFPGEAARYVEEMFDNRTVAVFSNGAEGDQNPRLAYTAPFRFRQPEPSTDGKGFNPQSAAMARRAIEPQYLPAYKKANARTGEYVVMLGTMIGTTVTRVMREDIKPVDSASIWGAQETITCPGRMRLDAASPARENVFPGYKDGDDVIIKVGLLRLGDINFVAVNARGVQRDRSETEGCRARQQDHIRRYSQRHGQFRVHLFGRSLQPPDVPGDRLAPETGLRGRQDRFQGDRTDASIRPVIAGQDPYRRIIYVQKRNCPVSPDASCCCIWRLPGRKPRGCAPAPPR